MLSECRRGRYPRAMAHLQCRVQPLRHERACTCSTRRCSLAFKMRQTNGGGLIASTTRTQRHTATLSFVSTLPTPPVRIVRACLTSRQTQSSRVRASGRAATFMRRRFWRIAADGLSPDMPARAIWRGMTPSAASPNDSVRYTTTLEAFPLAGGWEFLDAYAMLKQNATRTAFARRVAPAAFRVTRR